MCTFKGEPRFYIVHIVPDTDSPLAAGREIWGYPKKLARIGLETDGDMTIGTTERPRGNRICTGVMRPEEPIPPDPTAPAGGAVSLRVLPGAEEGAGPSVAELVEVPGKSTTLEAWSGPGFLESNSHSTLDPWHRLSVRRLLGASYRKYDMVPDYGHVIKRY